MLTARPTDLAGPGRRAPSQRQQQFQTWAASDGWMDFSDVRTAEGHLRRGRKPQPRSQLLLDWPLQVVFAGSGVIGTSGPHIKTRSLGELPPT